MPRRRSKSIESLNASLDVEEARILDRAVIFASLMPKILNADSTTPLRTDCPVADGATPLRTDCPVNIASDAEESASPVGDKLTMLLLKTLDRLDDMEERIARLSSPAPVPPSSTPSASSSPPPPSSVPSIKPVPAKIAPVSLKTRLRVFSGADGASARQWLDHVEGLLDLSPDVGNPMCPKIRNLLQAHLESNALLCVTRLPKTASFRDVRNQLLLYYPEQTPEAAEDRFDSLRQTSEIEAHILEFRTLYDTFLGCGGYPLSDLSLSAKFRKSLRPNLAKEVHRFQPTSLEQAIRLARHLAPICRPADHVRAITYDSNQRTKLTPEERLRCLQHGLCMFCRKPGHRIDACPERKPTAAVPKTTPGNA